MEEPDVRLGLGAAAAVAVGAAAAAGKNAAGDDTEDDSDDRVRMDVGVSFEATPTYTGTVGTEPRDREAGAYGGGTDGTDVYNDRSGDVADPPDNSVGQPADPDRT